MTDAEFIEKWAKHQDERWRENPDRAYWAASYDMNFPDIIKMSKDFLSLQSTKELKFSSSKQAAEYCLSLCIF